MLVMAHTLPGALVFTPSTFSFNADDDSEEFGQLSCLVSGVCARVCVCVCACVCVCGGGGGVVVGVCVCVCIYMHIRVHV